MLSLTPLLPLLPLLSLTFAHPSTEPLISKTLILPRATPNYGSCTEPFIGVYALANKQIVFRPTNQNEFNLQQDPDFFLVASYICEALRTGCIAPPETLQLCWDSYGRASELHPDKNDVWQMATYATKFNDGLKGLDPGNGGPPGPDHYEVEIWAGPMTVKIIQGGDMPEAAALVDEIFKVTDSGDFEKKTKDLPAKCKISTKGYKDLANGKKLSDAMKKVLLDLSAPDGLQSVFQYSQQRKAVHCNGWLVPGGGCCNGVKDEKTGKCQDGFQYTTFKYIHLPMTFSMYATIQPNNKRGNGHMEWTIECSDAGDIVQKDCTFCAQNNISGDKKTQAQKTISDATGGIANTIDVKCDLQKCKK
ncbi:uncharacterized protein BDR25DRAFT_316778 [Lindgomyces ingoldianus]|uniref:Uncharacterized protein n=1 Tax=Lindgomyces ingoldianus TaxID=673940 RepID=A0ACB6QKN5_9PLEO|nr:uncharacterized protein BDR25DRAFT_316778 [Lindgomyces ingoldianus]KAF2467432.1 hypothetical protein BDR25DRAFT_316778 [Lindgomyces ingoldianus]